MSGIEVGVAFRDGWVAPAGYNEVSPFSQRVSAKFRIFDQGPKVT